MIVEINFKQVALRALVHAFANPDKFFAEHVSEKSRAWVSITDTFGPHQLSDMTEAYREFERLSYLNPHDLYSALPSLSKKQSLKLKAGDRILVKWMDSNPVCGILTRRLVDRSGDVCIEFFDLENNCMCKSAVHSQIVACTNTPVQRDLGEVQTNVPV